MMKHEIDSVKVYFFEGIHVFKDFNGIKCRIKYVHSL